MKRLNECGAAAVEFALLLPILLMILVGIMEFGLIMFTQEVLTNASREGARAGIIQATPKPTTGAIQGVVVNYAQNARVALTPGDVAVVGAGGVFPNPLTVTVAYTYNFLVPGLFGLGPTVQLTAQTVMRHE
jgi:Flp pilus assembly protein TadG